MGRAVKVFWSYWDDGRAATAIEYGLIAAIISIASSFVILSVGQILLGTFQKLSQLI